MIPTVDMLEKEIEQFHTNIQNSSKLLEALSEVKEALNTQTQEINNRVAELQIAAQALPENIRSDFTKQADALCQELRNENSHQMKFLEEQQAALWERLEKTNVNQIYDFCQGMNKKINLKLNIAIGCGVVAAIISATSILLR